MNSPSVGPVIVVAGFVIVLIGLAIWSGAFGWFGRLPGDIHVKRDSFQVYIPLVSMLVISIVVSLLLYLFNRLH
jgi:hypothetical protein